MWGVSDTEIPFNYLSKGKTRGFTPQDKEWITPTPHGFISLSGHHKFLSVFQLSRLLWLFKSIKVWHSPGGGHSGPSNAVCVLQGLSVLRLRLWVKLIALFELSFAISAMGKCPCCLQLESLSNSVNMFSPAWPWHILYYSACVLLASYCAWTLLHLPCTHDQFQPQ